MIVAMCLGYMRSMSKVVLVDTAKITHEKLRTKIEEGVTTNKYEVLAIWDDLQILDSLDLALLYPLEVKVDALINVMEDDDADIYDDAEEDE